MTTDHLMQQAARAVEQFAEAVRAVEQFAEVMRRVYVPGPDPRRIVAEYCPGCGETHYPRRTGAAEYCLTCQYYGRDRATGGGPATATRTNVNLAQARRNADAIRVRLSDPQSDPLAFALSRNALDLADEVEHLRAKRDAYRDSALMYAARVAELNDEIAKLHAAQQEETR